MILIGNALKQVVDGGNNIGPLTVLCITHTRLGRIVEMETDESRRRKGRKMMKSVRTTAVALISGLLMSGVSLPAWSAPPVSEALTGAQVASAKPVLQAADGILAAAEFPRIQQIRPQAQSNCKPGHMYSADDIVGDPQACIMGGVSGFDGVHPTVAGVAAPAL
jgi:hypothetical protein